MPAAAVIPALIAYTKVAAVKKLVVGFLTSYNHAGRDLRVLVRDRLVILPIAIRFFFID